MDEFAFYNSQQEQKNEFIFQNSQYVYCPDQNSGSYPNGQVFLKNCLCPTKSRASGIFT